MDYKNKYEQALERARIWKDKSGMPKDKQGILDDIFPELKEESEDEKTEKEIINYLECQSMDEPTRKDTHNKWISYIKKHALSKDDYDFLRNCARVLKIFGYQSYAARLTGLCPALGEEAKAMMATPIIFDESKDDRIRKELLEHCINRRDGKQVCVDASDYRRWADWLLRQGVENKTNVKSDKEISNEIINFLELPHPQFVGKRHQEKWIAWLKKQGKDNIGISEVTKQKLEDNLNKALEKETPESWNEFIEKAGEHKYKIQPKFKIGDIIRFKGNETLKGETETHKIVSYDNELYVFADGTTDLFCEQDLYELVEQKPAWSEEAQEEQVSEEFINALDTMLNDGLPDGYLVSEERIKKSAELLFSIARKQLKIEMQEWNKEDENNISFLTSIIEECFKDKEKITLYSDTVCAHFTKEDVIDRLNSLRPKTTWKPSEEQMNLLEELVEDNNQRHFYTILRSLYEQLKKLKG